MTRKRVSSRTPRRYSERSLTVIPNGVRNLRFPFGGQPIPTTSHRMSSTLDSSECAPQNDREGGVPQNDTEEGTPQNDRGEGAPQNDREGGVPQNDRGEGVPQNDRGGVRSSE